MNREESKSTLTKLVAPLFQTTSASEETPDLSWTLLPMWSDDLTPATGPIEEKYASTVRLHCLHHSALRSQWLKEAGCGVDREEKVRLDDVILVGCCCLSCHQRLHVTKNVSFLAPVGSSQKPKRWAKKKKKRQEQVKRRKEKKKETFHQTAVSGHRELLGVVQLSPVWQPILGHSCI